MPTMRHPTLPEDQTVDMPDESVAGWEVGGWVVVDDVPDDALPADVPADQDAAQPHPHPTPQPGEPAVTEEI